MSDPDTNAQDSAPVSAEKYVVVSDSHALVGWARRLSLQGHDVSVFTSRPAFRHCWSGIMDVKLAPKGERPSAWGELGTDIVEGRATLLTDSRRVTDTFAGAPRVYGVGPGAIEGEPVLAVAVWWDEGATVSALAALEWGAWTGGQGPRALGAATLLPEVPGLTALTKEWLSENVPPGFRGLALVGLMWEPGSNTLRPCGAQLGWPALVHDLWLWRLEAEGAPGILTPQVCDPARAIDLRTLYLGVPISLPPWPHYPGVANRASEPAQLKLGPAAQHVAFHDVRREGGELVGGGSDGLVGVAVGAGRTLTRARRQVGAIAGAFASGDKRWQFRADAGAVCEEVLFTLDSLGAHPVD